MDADLSRRISDLRRQVDGKTTPNQVRAIVRQTLQSLEDRIRAAEGRPIAIQHLRRAAENQYYLPLSCP